MIDNIATLWKLKLQQSKMKLTPVRNNKKAIILSLFEVLMFVNESTDNLRIQNVIIKEKITPVVAG